MLPEKKAGCIWHNRRHQAEQCVNGWVNVMQDSSSVKCGTLACIALR